MWWWRPEVDVSYHDAAGTFDVKTRVGFRRVEFDGVSEGVPNVLSIAGVCGVCAAACL
jgi:hypothetical protein